MVAEDNPTEYNPYGRNISYLTAGDLRFAHDTLSTTLPHCPRNARAELLRKIHTIEAEMSRRGMKVPK